MKKWFKRVLSSAVAVAAFGLVTVSAQADSLPFPGNISGNPTTISAGDVPLAGDLIASASGNYTLRDAFNNDVGDGSFFERVYQDSTNGGNITISVAITGVTSGDVGRLSLSNFGTFTVDIFSSGGSGTGATSVTRNSTGSLINIDFSNAVIDPGGSSQTFYLRTNANFYTVGNLAIQDTGNTNKATFSPTTAPLPSTASVGLCLLGGLGAWTLLRRRNAATAGI